MDYSDTEHITLTDYPEIREFMRAWWAQIHPWPLTQPSPWRYDDLERGLHDSSKEYLNG